VIEGAEVVALTSVDEESWKLISVGGGTSSERWVDGVEEGDKYIEQGPRLGGGGVIISTWLSPGKEYDDKGDDLIEDEVQLRVMEGVNEKGQDAGEDEVLDDGDWS
jgi:hypothetical protein